MDKKQYQQFAEYQQIAALTHDSGYLYLLEVLKARIDDVTTELDGAEPSKELQILGKWRAMREIYNILSVTPESFALTVKEDREVAETLHGPSMPDRFSSQKTPQSPAEIESLKRKYEEVTGRKVVLI